MTSASKRLAAAGQANGLRGNNIPANELMSEEQKMELFPDALLASQQADMIIKCGGEPSRVAI